MVVLINDLKSTYETNVMIPNPQRGPNMEIPVDR
jgi:hypothetical protein